MQQNIGRTGQAGGESNKWLMQPQPLCSCPPHNSEGKLCKSSAIWHSHRERGDLMVQSHPRSLEACHLPQPCQASCLDWLGTLHASLAWHYFHDFWLQEWTTGSLSHIFKNVSVGGGEARVGHKGCENMWWWGIGFQLHGSNEKADWKLYVRHQMFALMLPKHINVANKASPSLVPSFVSWVISSWGSLSIINKRNKVVSNRQFRPRMLRTHRKTNNCRRACGSCRRSRLILSAWRFDWKIMQMHLALFASFPPAVMMQTVLSARGWCIRANKGKRGCEAASWLIERRVNRGLFVFTTAGFTVPQDN